MKKLHYINITEEHVLNESALCYVKVSFIRNKIVYVDSAKKNSLTQP